MALPAFLPYVLPFVPKIIDSNFGSGDQRSAYERDMESKLRGIIYQGGIGMNMEQLNRRYKEMIDQLRPMFQSQRNAYDANAAGRGIYKSGVAFQKGNELAAKQSQQMATLLQNLMQWNEEQKNNSLMQALGMGSQQAGQYGDLSRIIEAQNQAAFQDMWGNLLGLMLEKNMFKF